MKIQNVKTAYNAFLWYYDFLVIFLTKNKNIFHSKFIFRGETLALKSKNYSHFECFLKMHFYYFQNNSFD